MTEARPGAAERILFVEHSAVLTGGQVSCLNMARICVDDGRPTTLLYPMGGSMEAAARKRLGDAADHVAGPDIEFTDRRKTLGDLLKLVWLTLSALRFLPLFARHDVIYVSSARWFIQAFFLSHFVRRRFVYHVRVDNSALEKRLIRMIARSPRTHAVVVNTEFVRDKLYDAHPDLRQAPRFLMLRTPVFPPFNALPFEDRFTDADPAAPFTVALVGRLTPTKGQDILPAIAAALPRFRFVVIGAETAEFRDYAAALRRDCPANVVFHGESRDVAGTLREIGAQFSLVPSRWDDPFPLVASESICCSCITLVRRMGGLTDLAARLDLPAFDRDDEVPPLFEALAAKPPAELTAIARAQHEGLGRRFRYETFVEEFRRLCFGPAPAAGAGAARAQGAGAAQ